MIEVDAGENPYAQKTTTKLPPITLKEWGFLLVLAAIQFTNIMDFMIIMPLEPRYKVQWPDISPFGFSLIVMAYGVAAGFSGLLGPFFNDRFDRKRSLLALYAGFTIGTFLCAIASNYWTLVAARLVAGAFGGVMGAATLAIVGDLFHDARRGRATGVLMWGFSVASIVGVPAGLMLADTVGNDPLRSIQIPFGALAAFSLVIWILALLTLPAIKAHLVGDPQHVLLAMLRVMTDATHLRAYLFMFVLTVSTFLLAPFMAAYIVANVGRSKEELKWIYVFGGLATFVTLPLVGVLADRYGKPLVYRVCGTLTIIPILMVTNLTWLLGLANVPPAWTLPVTLAVTTLFMIISSARSVPAMAMITASTRPRYRGSFLSVSASVQQFGCAIAAAVAGMLLVQKENDEKAPLEGFPIVGVLAVISAVASVLLAERLRPAEIEPNVENAPETEEELIVEGRASDTGVVSTS